MSEWFHGKRFARHPGTPGVYVILADTSGSMCGILDQVEKATRQLMKENSQARTFLFSNCTKEFTGGHWPENPGGTDMARAFLDIAYIRPAKTFLISDGGPDWPAKTFEAADGVTGAIDSLWLSTGYPEYHQRNRDFMREIARRSGGRFHEADGQRLTSGDLHRKLRQAEPAPASRQEEQPMDLPKEFRLQPGSAINVKAPPTQTVYVPEVIEIHKQRVFVERRMDDKWIKEDDIGAPVQITSESSAVTLQENHEVIEHRGFLKSLLFGPTRRQEQAALPAPGEKYRRHLTATPDAPALAAPVREPMLIEHQAAEPMTTGRILSRVLIGK